MKKYKAGLLIGRFQPFHKGHLFLIRHALKSVEKLIIGVGSANIFDSNNPFDIKERKIVLDKVITEEKWGNRILKIIDVNDYHDDEEWFRHIYDKAGTIDVVIGNNEWTNVIFEKHGYPVLRAGYYKRVLYEGEKIRSYINAKMKWENRVPSYIVPLINEYLQTNHKKQYRFDHIGVGGTFDHFHKGHEALINIAFKYGKHVSIGLATEKLYRHKVLSEKIESFEARRKSVEMYLESKGYLSRARIFPLSDIYGKANTDGTIEAIVVTKESYKNAIKINHEREKHNLPQMKLIVVSYVLGEDGEAISSERIRKGEIDRNGKQFPISNFQFPKPILILPEHMRVELRKPLGKVVSSTKELLQLFERFNPLMVVAVGDIIVARLIDEGFSPDIAIIDYRSRRRTLYSEDSLLRRASFKNDAGTITYEASEAIRNAIDIYMKTKEKQTVIIKGEEDLMALPSILHAPLGSVVTYGHFELGIISVVVDMKIKEKVVKLLQHFQ